MLDFVEQVETADQAKRQHQDKQKDKRLVQSTGSPVAFMESVSKQVDHIGIDQNIHFDDVQLNLGNSYHKFQGAFIAPQNVIYLISSSESVL